MVNVPIPNNLDIKAEIKGLKEAQRKAEQVLRDMHGQPMVTAMRRATLIVQRDAMKNAPVDTGRLKSSITPDIQTRGIEVIGVVGSNVEYAPFQEFGFWPPKGRQGPRYLARAIEENAARIWKILGDAVANIIEREP